MENRDPKVGPYGLAPHEKYTECPYDKNHLVRDVRILSHLVKCRKQHLKKCKANGDDVSYLFCRYNFAHHIPPGELLLHEEDCPDRYENALFAFVMQESDLQETIATPPTPQEKAQEFLRISKEIAQKDRNGRGRSYYAYDSNAPTMITAVSSNSIESFSESLPESEQEPGPSGTGKGSGAFYWYQTRPSTDVLKHPSDIASSGSLTSSSNSNLSASRTNLITTLDQDEQTRPLTARVLLWEGVQPKGKETAPATYHPENESSESTMSIINRYKDSSANEETATSTQESANMLMPDPVEDEDDGSESGSARADDDDDEEWVLNPNETFNFIAKAESAVFFQKPGLTKSEKKRHRAGVAERFRAFLALRKDQSGGTLFVTEQPKDLPAIYVDPSVVYDNMMEREDNPNEVFRPRESTLEGADYGKRRAFLNHF